MKRNELITRLSDAFGPSGFEEDVVRIIRSALEDTSYDLSSDQMKNLYAVKSSDGLSIMLDAHTDEVSFMVKSIHPSGMLSFLNLGSISANNVGAQKVLIRSKDGTLHPGIIASVPPHFQPDKDKAPKTEDLMIDLGVSSEEEVRKLGIEVGDPGIFHVSSFVDSSRDLAFGKAFDCRIGCAAVIEVLRILDEEGVAAQGSFSVQEEVGTRGAFVSARTLKPDVAIVFEGAPADDTFGKPHEMQCKLHHGPMLRHLDVRMITHPGFQRLALEVAEREGIDVQRAVRSGGGTNGAAIHLSNEGIPTIVISIPVRYIHTAHSWTSMKDFDAAVRLAVALVKELDENLLSSWLV